MKKITLILLSLMLITMSSCKKETDDDLVVVDPTTPFIPAGMENKLVFEGVYNDMTTDFTHGDVYFNDTICTLDLFFIDTNSSDTLNLYMGDLAATGTSVDEGTYNFSTTGMFSYAIAGDWTHGEFFADSGTVVLQKTGSNYEIALELFGDGFGGGGAAQRPATLTGYFQNGLTIK